MSAVVYAALLAVAAPPAVLVGAASGEPTTTPAVSLARLESGATLVVAPRSAVPWARFRLTLPLGSAGDPPGKSGLARAVGMLLEAALGTSAPADEPRRLARLGARVRVETTPGATAVEGAVAEEHLDAALRRVTRRLLELELSPEAVHAAVARAIFERQALDADPRAVARLQLRRMILGAHPGAREVRGAVEELATLTDNDARAAWQKQLRAGGVVLALTHTASAAALARRAEAWLEGLPPGAATPVVRDPPAPTRTRRILVVDAPGLREAVILAGKLARPHTDPRHAATIAASTALAGGFTARLPRALGAATTPEGLPAARLETRAGAGLWTIELAAEHERVPRTIAALFEELERVYADGLEGRDLELGRGLGYGRAQLELFGGAGRLAALTALVGDGPLLRAAPVALGAELDLEVKRLADPGELAVVVVSSATPALERALANLPGVREVSIVGF